MSRFARPFFNSLIVAGLIIAAWPVGQTLYGLWSQRSLAAQWQAQTQNELTAKTQSRKNGAKSDAKTTPNIAVKVTGHDPSSPAPAIQNATIKKSAPWLLTKFSIPDIDVNTFVVQGMDAAALRRGPGHDINSSPPGTGNCVIAGHRNIYGSFFYRLDELLPGQTIILENRTGKWIYVVNSVYVTPDTDLTVLQLPPEGHAPVLTLITCTLPHSNNRIVLKANLSEE